MKDMNPKTALAILMGLRNGDEEALHLVPMQEDLPSALTHLSDVAAAAVSHLTDVSDECRHADKTEAFTKEDLPLQEMGQYALHLTLCMSCRTALSNKGVRRYERSTELLRHVLAELTTDSKSTT